MRDNRHDPRRANGVHPHGLHPRAVPLHDQSLVDTDHHEPLDLVAVQADDELINALSAGFPVVSAGGRGAEDRVAAVLAAWKAEVDAAPVPELVDVDTAVAAITAAGGGAARRRSARVRHLAPVAAAAAFLVITLGGVSIGSSSAQPDDVLWPVSKVLFAERAASVEAADRVQEHIDNARQALVEGRPEVAAQELQRAGADLGVIRPEEGLVELAEVQDFLLAKAAETPPGTAADLGAPLTTQPNRPVPPGAVAPLPAVPPAPLPSGTGTGVVPPAASIPSPGTGTGTIVPESETDRPVVPLPPNPQVAPLPEAPQVSVPRESAPETTALPSPDGRNDTAPGPDPQGTTPQGTTQPGDPEPTTLLPDDRTESQAPSNSGTSTSTSSSTSTGASPDATPTT